MKNKLSQAGVTNEEIIKILNQLVQENEPSVKINQIENLRSRVQSPEHSQRLAEILGALKVPDSLGGGLNVKDPISGEAYPNTNNLIKQYIEDLSSLQKMSKTFNLEKFSQEMPEKKKKTRGNPFRVLMGKVGKLLDHGLDKRTIIRYLLKEKIWNETTIEKAVNLVKDYNKKKHVKQVEAQTLPNAKNDWPKMNPDYAKRSNAELIVSLCWLNSLQNLNPKTTWADIKEVEDKTGVKNMIREIKAELSKRGLAEDNLDTMLNNK